MRAGPSRRRRHCKICRTIRFEIAAVRRGRRDRGARPSRPSHSTRCHHRDRTWRGIANSRLKSLNDRPCACTPIKKDRVSGPCATPRGMNRLLAAHPMACHFCPDTSHLVLSRVMSAVGELGPWRVIEDVGHDIIYGLRSLVGNKAFAIAAVVTLGFGIGATTAIFSLVNGVVFRSLPFAAPERLVQMYGTPAIRGETVSRLAEIRSQSRSFDALVGYNLSAGHLQSANGPERVMTVAADRDFFSMLGVVPAIGRGFHADDPTTVAVVSDEFWKRVLGGTPSAIGARLAFNNTPLTVIGIMPAAFQFPYGAASVLHSVTPQARTDLWMPLDPPSDPALRGRVGYVTGRLKPEVSIQEAEAELAVISRRLQDADPDPYGARGVRLEPLPDVVVARPIRRSLFVLFASVIIVLALAAINVANLSLVRMTLRSREVATRAARGSGPLRLCRQFLTES